MGETAEETRAKARERYEAWLANPHVDTQTKAELASIASDENEITERFYKDLDFGTAGLRGIMAAGSNRMNIYTVRRATQGVMNYLRRKDPDAPQKGIAIAYDCRHHSAEFAQEAAAVANANGFKAYVFDSLRPTPELSFAIRYLGCKSGIVVTASHNPKAYNGYKVYWEDGCQVPPPMDGEIISEVDQVDLFEGVSVMPREEAEAKGLYIQIGREIDEAFQKAVLDRLVEPELDLQAGRELCIIYTPLHGTGLGPISSAMKAAGFTNFHVVPSQEQPDGDFPSTPNPNPEFEEVFTPGIELANQVGGDIIIATDPDADRMGIMVRTARGFVHFNGNMTGCLLLSHILSGRKRRGTLPRDGFMVKTIVSTEMVRAIARDYGVEVHEVLTGFKYIGGQILKSEQTGHGTYLFGFEESYGYLCGTYARDKDSVSASLLAAELALLCKRQGKTLADKLDELYRQYGYYHEDTISLPFEGMEGTEKMAAMIDAFRHHPKSEYAGLKVLSLRDYAQGIEGLPRSNVLRFTLEDSAWFCVRPSGTEPKIKFYFGVKGRSQQEAQALSHKLEEEILPCQ